MDVADLPIKAPKQILERVAVVDLAGRAGIEAHLILHELLNEGDRVRGDVERRPRCARRLPDEGARRTAHAVLLFRCDVEVELVAEDRSAELKAVLFYVELGGAEVRRAEFLIAIVD